MGYEEIVLVRYFDNNETTWITTKKKKVVQFVNQSIQQTLM
jgi:hypothetical protein